MQLKGIFDSWVSGAKDHYADRQWLLSKWEVVEGVEWPPEKIQLMLKTIREGLGLQPDDRLADLGCGGGWIAESLRPWARDVVGVDFSAEMLHVARSSGPGPWVQGAIGQLPLREASFDRALCYFVFLNFADDVFVLSAIADIYRILKPGGTALIGQLPLQGMNARYDADKAEYLDYCQRTMRLGPRNDSGTRVPLRSFDREQLSAALRCQGIRHGFRPSFNPFYREGAPETVDWRFDLVIGK